MKFCELFGIRTQSRSSEQCLNRSHIPCATFEHFETSIPFSGRKQENMNHVEELQQKLRHREAARSV